MGSLHDVAGCEAAVGLERLEKGGLEEMEENNSLDVRDLAPRLRPEKIFATFHILKPGEAFVLVNDHDPKPLYYQFQAEHTGQFSWDYFEQGPEVWRVRIGRVG